MNDFSRCLAGVYNGVCEKHNVESKIAERIEDLDGYETDDSVGSIIDNLAPEQQETVRRAQIHWQLHHGRHHPFWSV